MSYFDVEQLQGEIDALMEWSKLWILSFNILKCKYLQIGDLGVNIDTNLFPYKQLCAQS